MFVKVMTDEHMEVLRKQIAVYATICEQLVELHKSLTSQNDLAGGGVTANLSRKKATPPNTTKKLVVKLVKVNVGFFVACYAEHFIVGKAMDVEAFEIENEQARLSNLLHNHAKLKLQNGDDYDNDIEFLPPLPNDFRELLICKS